MDIALLKQLSEANGISGKEDAVRNIILGHLDGLTEDIRIDPLGSITCIKGGTGKSKLRVMLVAHMDEVGFMATGVDSDGLVRFTAVGGIDDRILPGKRVKIGANALPGVIGWVPIHLNQDQTVVKMSNLRIDIGATSKDDANGKVKMGDMIVFDAAFGELGDSMLRGKAFDDRAGCALLIEVLRGEPYPFDLLAAFTVQEEIGLRGAQVVAQYFSPDIAFVLECTTANDIPNPLANPDDEEYPNPTCRVQGGPVLTLLDRSLIADPRLVRHLQTTADKHAIPYQHKTMPGGGTDGGAIHTSNVGVATAVISLPARYIHSPLAYLHRDDFENTLRLIQGALRELPEKILR
jgi:tetrahedral aminopeptidase